jgi:hypothetical protein
MDDKFAVLLEKLKALERELLAEVQKKEAHFGYTIEVKSVVFTAAAAANNKKFAQKLSRYLHEAKIFNILTAPVIWSVLIPALMLDLVITLYQFICFPVYAIPKVRRADYIVVDRHKLGYLNFFEKLNCAYCGYVNGLLAYATEVAGRTEQYWCPIKHALRLKAVHSRYQKFFEYGDAESYRQRLKQVSEDFEDLKKES